MGLFGGGVVRVHFRTLTLNHSLIHAKRHLEVMPSDSWLQGPKYFFYKK